MLIGTWAKNPWLGHRAGPWASLGDPRCLPGVGAPLSQGVGRLAEVMAVTGLRRGSLGPTLPPARSVTCRAWDRAGSHTHF